MWDGLPVGKIFPRSKFSQGGFVNKEELVAKFTEEKRTAVESIGAVREQIMRLQNEERRLTEVQLRLEGCLHALSELSTVDEKAVQVVKLVPNEDVQDEPEFVKT